MAENIGVQYRHTNRLPVDWKSAIGGASDFQTIVNFVGSGNTNRDKFYHGQRVVSINDGRQYKILTNETAYAYQFTDNRKIFYGDGSGVGSASLPIPTGTYDSPPVFDDDIGLVSNGSTVFKFYKYGSSQWTLIADLSFALTGGISGVTAGDGLSGGGTSGTVTIAVDGTVVRTAGAQSIAGQKTFTDQTTIRNNFRVQAEGEPDSWSNRFLVDQATGNATIYGRVIADTTGGESDIGASDARFATIHLTGFNLIGATNGQILIADGTAGAWRFGTLPPGTITSITAGDGMDFTTITGSGPVTMGTPSTPLTHQTTNAVTATSHTHAITTVLPASSTAGIMKASGAKAAGGFYGGSSDPTDATRLNYDGTFHATHLTVHGQAYTPQNNATAGATTIIDFNTSNVQFLDVTTNITSLQVNPSNIKAGSSYIIMMKSTGANRTVAFHSDFIDIGSVTLTDGEYYSWTGVCINDGGLKLIGIFDVAAKNLT